MRDERSSEVILIATGCLLLLATLVLAREETPKTATPQPLSGEVRALWVVRNTLTSQEKIEKMVESAAAAGFESSRVAEYQSAG